MDYLYDDVEDFATYLKEMHCKREKEKSKRKIA